MSRSLSLRGRNEKYHTNVALLIKNYSIAVISKSHAYVMLKKPFPPAVEWMHWDIDVVLTLLL